MALVACLAAEWGDKAQMLCARRAQRRSTPVADILAALVAALAVALFAAGAEALLAPMLGLDARLLFLALAFLFAAASAWWPVRAGDAAPPDHGFLGLALRLGILIGSGNAPFLIAAIALARGYVPLAVAGGTIGIVAASAAALLGVRVARMPSAGLVRRIASLPFALIGALAGLRALGLN